MSAALAFAAGVVVGIVLGQLLLFGAALRSRARDRSRLTEAGHQADTDALRLVASAGIGCPNATVCSSCPCSGEDDVCMPAERAAYEARLRRGAEERVA